MKFITATKSQKVSQKSNVPQVPYIKVAKDNACPTPSAIQFFPKGGARDWLQGDKTELGQVQYIQFGLCEKAETIAFKVIPTEKQAKDLMAKGVQIRPLNATKNLNGGYGASSLKKSVKNPKGLDFTDMENEYIGAMEKVNPKDNGGFQFIAKLSKVEK